MPDDRIEAKLAAYIDGELPADEAADVERYLAGNPRQRHVVEQMIQARNWTASLPRARAPRDLLESIDPTLERSALFDESATPPARWGSLVSPQVLALAATVALVATLGIAMLWLLPERGGEVPVAENQPQEPTQGGTGLPEGPLANNQQPEAPQDPVDDRDPDEPMSIEPFLGGTDDPIANRAEQGEPVAPARLPADISETILVSADVPSLPTASGAVSAFLTSEDLPIDAQRVPAEALPAELRERLGLSPGQTVVLYVVERMSLEQVGSLTSQLTREGNAHAEAPASFVTSLDPERAATRGAAEEPLTDTRIHAEDRLRVVINRQDEPPAEPPPGMPPLGKQTSAEVTVSQDGYADFGGVGLGRIDVLGRLPAEVAERIKAELANFQIPAEVEVGILAQGQPDGVRRREAVHLTLLDRDPLKTGDLVQIELPDGGWVHAVVNDEGMLDLGEGRVMQAAGLTPAAVEKKLAELLGDPTTKPSTGPAGGEIRVVNLSARRAQHVDSWADLDVSCIVVLRAPAEAETPQPQTQEADPWAPLLEPTTRPATRP